MSQGGLQGRGGRQLTPAQPPAREIRGLDKYCIRCNQSFKSNTEKIDHDRTIHGS